MHDEYQTFNHGIPAGYVQGTHRTAALQVHGAGITKLQFGISADTQPIPAPDLCKVHNGPIRMTMGDDREVTSVGYARHTHTDTGTAGGSVMGTLRTTGSSASVELTPGDPSTRTLLKTAEHEGLIRRTAIGWEDVGTGTVTADPQKAASDELARANQPEAEEAGDLSMGAVDESLWAEDIADLSQPGYDRATASTVGHIAHGTGSIESIAESLARDEAMDPALALDYVTQGIAMGQRTVDRAMGTLGIQGAKLEAFYASVRAQPAKLQDAIQRLAHQRDLSGFKALAVEWKIANTDLSAYTKAGFQAAVDRQSGEVLLQRGAGKWVKASELFRG